MLLHERVTAAYVVRPSVCPFGVTFIYCDHITRATSNAIARIISPVSQLFTDITSESLELRQTLLYSDVKYFIGFPVTLKHMTLK